MKSEITSEQAGILSNHLLTVSGVYEQCLVLAGVAQEFISDNYNKRDIWDLATVLVALMLKDKEVNMALLPQYSAGIKKAGVA